MNIPKTFVAFLWHFIKRQPIGFAVIFITAAIWSVNEMFFPYFLKLIINAVHDFKGNPADIYTVLMKPLLLLGVFWVSMEVAMRTQGIVAISLFPRFRANIRYTVYDYVKKHSMEYFSNHFAGAIAKKIADLPTSCQSIMEILSFNFTSILCAFVIAVVLMWMTNVIFALILLLWFFLQIGSTLLFLGVGNRYWQIHSDAVASLSGKIVDGLTNILSVRLFAHANFENQYLKKFQADEIKKAKKAMLVMEIMRFFQAILAMVLIFTIVLLMVHGWIKHWITIGDFALIGTLTFLVLGMVWYMSYQMTIFSREMGTINEALSLITQGHGITDALDAKVLSVTKGEIYFKDVTFNYQKNIPVFQNLNVTIPAAQKIGLVGFSGSGKSTFVNLLLRFYDIKNGVIAIDNQNIAEVKQDSLRQQIAMIPQEPMLFHRTLMENIRYGCLDASDEEVIAAAKLAHCHEFIAVLPENYHTLVGERGIKLSGGQRQRIAIARAILKKAPILVLDEATSALDSVTEKLIQESLNRLMQNCTTIVVAHRLSTLADMDRILVFEQGKIVEDGTKEELLNANGHFAYLWKMQSDGFLPEQASETTF